MVHWGEVVKDKTDQYGALVIGIDPVWGDIPKIFKDTNDSIRETLDAYIDCLLTEAAGRVGFVKFQAAFFEAFGLAGLQAMARAFRCAKENGMSIILDAKRGDIGSTAEAYANAYLSGRSSFSNGDFEVDCLTVNPFLGPDGVKPFVDRAKANGKGIFLLVKTSNPGSAWLQDQIMLGRTVSQTVADLVHELGQDWLSGSRLSAIGAVIGATHSSVLDDLRARMPNSIMLCPGLGPQGGSVENILRLRTAEGYGALAPVSRGLTKPKRNGASLVEYRQLVSERIDYYKSALNG